ncbi:NADH-quinone oxidoreductase, E subunit [Propionibacterium sp. oral taxon 192 str. F0372]|mgnify:CR=1 FL=1|uniref:NADH-quinone oxidoreductase subunit NuoE n=1 Tax=Propionibacterium sp. oral taxon 192 TaxID=671222 RepID=UPI0003541749|nr:NADH-quinone oxidoreductase subunit NuoE [Propionibacterium sp. oral taxon 192]EPH07183.1 NADH-quinone oxidoreductase, E subunit [Propionibacterium sp. oral taxon 192 str. F0372]
MSGHGFASHYDDAQAIDSIRKPTAITETTIAEMREIMARYPEPRSALLPMLHLAQSIDGCVTDGAVKICADLLGISEAQVNGVATFYTMYKRREAGEHHIGVCTTSLCAVMGGDALIDQMKEKLGIDEGETTADGKFSLERLECNAACDFAPVMMVNWEFMDQMTPEKADKLIDALVAGQEVRATRGATITSFKQAERVLAGFPDGRADEGPSAAGASLAGLEIARQRGWKAPEVPQTPAIEGEEQ